MKLHFPSWRLLCATALALWFVLPCSGDSAGQPENRFLFVIDTASSMQSYSNSVVRTVAELLGSDMKGQFRDGDTIGVWTYNDQLHTEFPMQVWSKDKHQTVLDTIAGYLIQLRYEKPAHLDKVMPMLNQVIKTSDRLTVILVFDGSGSIQGTPFDKDIARLQKKFRKELRSAHVPFVLVLAARKGAVFDYTVNYPGLISIPPTALPEVVKKVEKTNAPPVVVAKLPPPRPRPMRSIIMTRATNAPHTNAPVKAAPTLVLAAPLVAKPIAQAPPVVTTPVAPVPTPKPQPAPVAVVMPPVTNVAPVKSNPPPVAPVAAAPIAATHPAPTNEPKPSPPLAATSAVTNVVPAGNSQTGLFVLAFALLLVAVVMIVFLMRRSGNSSGSSLITQSIDRPGNRPKPRR